MKQLRLARPGPDEAAPAGEAGDQMKQSARNKDGGGGREGEGGMVGVVGGGGGWGGVATGSRGMPRGHYYVCCWNISTVVVVGESQQWHRQLSCVWPPDPWLPRTYHKMRRFPADHSDSPRNSPPPPVD